MSATIEKRWNGVVGFVPKDAREVALELCLDVGEPASRLHGMESTWRTPVKALTATTTAMPLPRPRSGR